MSKQRLMEARELMNAKRYDEARMILEGLDHPRAKEWLAQIEKEQPRAGTSSGGSGIGGYIVTIFVSILLTSLLIAGLLLATRSSWYKPSTTIVQGIATATRPTSTTSDANGEATAEATTEATAEAATEAPTEEPSSGITGVVQSNQSINVRSGPGTNFQSVKSLMPGTEVVILGQNPDGSWTNVRLSDRTEGWVSTSLLEIDEEALPTAEATVDSVIPPCQGSEAQTWWNGGPNIIYNMTRFNVKRFQARQIVAENLPTFAADIDTLHRQFEQTTHPDCVETIHDTFVSTLTEINDAAQAFNEAVTSGADTSAAIIDLQSAAEEFTRVDALLDSAGIIKFSTTCDLDDWLVGIWPSYEGALTVINAYDPATITPQTARPQIFDLRGYSQSIRNATSPECGLTAQTHLVNSLTAGEALFQAIYEGGTPSTQGAMYEELEAFHREMNRIGFPISRPR